MKKSIKKCLAFLLSAIMLFAVSACKTAQPEADLWESAIYTEDQELGNGAKTAVVEVAAGDKSVTFTLRTDAETVGEALFEHKLVDGEESEFGLYVKAVNGIVADFDIDKTYWAFYINGDYAISGMDTTEITEGVTYRLERTK